MRTQSVLCYDENPKTKRKTLMSTLHYVISIDWQTIAGLTAAAMACIAAITGGALLCIATYVKLTYEWSDDEEEKKP
jgi:hypothetical protein